jgi:hypothetical protein
MGNARDDRLEITRIGPQLRGWLLARAAAANLTIGEFVGQLLCREAGLTPEEGLVPRKPAGRKPRGSEVSGRAAGSHRDPEAAPPAVAPPPKKRGRPRRSA